jgi:S-adenosylmethionine decarboxylase proenzyme
MEGLHIIASLYRCRGDARYLVDAELLQSFCADTVNRSGLTVVGALFHRFPGADAAAGGVTGCIVLAESHLAIHTWPELESVTLDLFACNYSADNSARAHSVVDAIVALFAPAEIARQDVLRQGPGATPEVARAATLSSEA